MQAEPRGAKIAGGARVAQLVEHELPKLGVASSNLVSRSNFSPAGQAPPDRPICVALAPGLRRDGFELKGVRLRCCGPSAAPIVIPPRSARATTIDRGIGEALADILAVGEIFCVVIKPFIEIGRVLALGNRTRCGNDLVALR